MHKDFTACIGMTAHLSEPKKIMGDGGGAALDLYQRDLVFSCHQDVVFVVEDSGQIHSPDENDARQAKKKYIRDEPAQMKSEVSIS